MVPKPVPHHHLWGNFYQMHLWEQGNEFMLSLYSSQSDSCLRTTEPHDPSSCLALKVSNSLSLGYVAHGLSQLHLSLSVSIIYPVVILLSFLLHHSSTQEPSVAPY